MKKSILILAFFLLVISQFSCKKDNNLSKKDLLTGKTWIIISKALTPSVSVGGITIDDINILDSEDQRNYTFKYNTDGTMIEYNKAKEEIYRTNWSFNSDETQISHTPGIVFSYPMVGDYTLTTMSIESISANQLITKVVYNFLGTDYVATFTYSPK